LWDQIRDRPFKYYTVPAPGHSRILTQSNSSRNHQLAPSSSLIHSFHLKLLCWISVKYHFINIPFLSSSVWPSFHPTCLFVAGTCSLATISTSFPFLASQVKRYVLPCSGPTHTARYLPSWLEKKRIAVPYSRNSPARCPDIEQGTLGNELEEVARLGTIQTSWTARPFSTQPKCYSPSTMRGSDRRDGDE
jgi:hypothetical protein